MDENNAGHDDTAALSPNEKLRRFIQRIPKVELHAHLNGCIRESTLFQLAEERNVKLSPHHFAAVDQTLSTNDEHTMYNVKPRSLQDCFDMFDEIPKCVNDLPSLRRITREALEDFRYHHVAYLELRSTPKRLLREWNSSEISSKREYIETIVSVLDSFEHDELERYEREHCAGAECRLPLRPRFIVSIDRSASLDEAMEHAQLAIDLVQSGVEKIVGVDLGGNPTKNDFRDFEPAFHLVRNAGLKITIHCGEVQCGESEIDDQCKHGLAKTYEEASAVLRFRPDRLGHALLLPKSLQHILDESLIPVESCPTSNVMTLELATSFHGHLVEGLQHHPQLGHWLNTKYPISISTDDSGVFNTDPTKELFLLAVAWNLCEWDIQCIIMDSIQHAFCDEETQVILHHRLSKCFVFYQSLDFLVVN